MNSRSYRYTPPGRSPGTLRATHSYVSTISDVTTRLSGARLHWKCGVRPPPSSDSRRRTHRVGQERPRVALARDAGGELVNCDPPALPRPGHRHRQDAPYGAAASHHLVDLLEPHQVFNAGDYAALARPVLRQIAERGAVPVVAGGTGSILRALLDGLAEGPKRDDRLRQDLARRRAAAARYAAPPLNRLMRAAAARIHPNDHNKLIRAIEIACSPAAPPPKSSARTRAAAGFHVLKLRPQSAARCIARPHRRPHLRHVRGRVAGGGATPRPVGRPERRQGFRVN